MAATLPQHFNGPGDTSAAFIYWFRRRSKIPLMVFRARNPKNGVVDGPFATIGFHGIPTDPAIAHQQRYQVVKSIGFLLGSGLSIRAP